MTKTASISANIPIKLGAMLDTISKIEERSKSYYIKKGLEKILKEKMEDLEDYEEAKKAYKAFKDSNEKLIPFDDVFKDI